MKYYFSGAQGLLLALWMLPVLRGQIEKHLGRAEFFTNQGNISDIRYKMGQQSIYINSYRDFQKVLVYSLACLVVP